MDIIQLLLSGGGGAVLGPIVARLLGGQGFGTLGNVIAGILGGVGAGYGADAAGLSGLLGNSELMGMIQTVLEGGVGGGVVGALAGILKRN
ncbi:MAG: hypothetical protein AAFX03_01995 [Pseudomonadota bacterium]